MKVGCKGCSLHGLVFVMKIYKTFIKIFKYRSYSAEFYDFISIVRRFLFTITSSPELFHSTLFSITAIIAILATKRR